LIIDSRKQEEYAKGHIEGAVSLLDTHMSPEILKQHTPSKNTPILFYCNGPRCLRSANAIIKAQQWGYHNLYWFRGGWAEWRDKKLPITK
jgi:rhodanese-related sulfurtransferase